MNKINIIILLVLFCNITFAQLGPAGIENPNGTSNLVLWLDANKGVTVQDINSPGDLTAWEDLSGYNNDYAGINNPNNDYPKLVENYANTNSSVIFSYEYTDASGNFLRNAYPNFYINDDNSLDLTEWDIFIVIKTYNRFDYNQYYNKGVDWANTNYSLRSNDYGRYSNPTHYTDGSTSYYDTPQYLTSSSDYQVLNSTFSTANGNDIYRNLRLREDNSENKTPETNNENLTFGYKNSSEYLDGEITEIIFFNRQLNFTERIIISNYLSAKYDIDLAEYDIYHGDYYTRGEHDFDVAGIGSLNGDIINESQGTGIVRINNPSDLDDKEFLFWGHDNGDDNASEITDVPTGVEARLGKVWKAFEASTSGFNYSIDVGCIDISFDLSDYGSINAGDLRLLVDTDLDGNFNDETAISGATHIGDDVYQFTGVTAIANYTSFTIGTTNLSTTPLPVEYLNFEVENIDNEYAHINWTTATETNSDYFEVEKSYEMDVWETVNIVTAAGNSNSILNYEIDDYNLNENTIYYRLKQVDFDGNYEYSEIKTVAVNNNKNPEAIAYPNPFSDIVFVNNSNINSNSLKVYNEMGQDVTNSVQIISNNENEIVLDFSSLHSGVFLISNSDDYTVKVYKQ